jgi:hypothetical protein
MWNGHGGALEQGPKRPVEKGTVVNLVEWRGSLGDRRDRTLRLGRSETQKTQRVDLDLEPRKRKKKKITTTKNKSWKFHLSIWL